MGEGFDEMIVSVAVERVVASPQKIAAAAVDLARMTRTTSTPLRSIDGGRVAV
jgi:hypothetical protein